MTRKRLLLVVTALVVLGTGLGFWAVLEARRQRLETEASLRRQASILALSLAPALSAASASARELHEIVSWRLLDNARLIGRLDAEGSLTDRELREVLENADLDVILIVDRRGNTLRRVGPEGPPDLLQPDVLEVAEGAASEAILDWSSASGPGHLVAATGRPGSGAVVVSAHTGTVYAFASQLGLENLLQDTVGTGGVLYLAFSDRPDGLAIETSWDGGPVPSRSDSASGVRSVRGVDTFEIEVPVSGPAGMSGVLRVGLDAGPMLQASVSATRRTALVGFVLAAFGFAGVAFALVSRARVRERAEAERRLAEAEQRRRLSERLAAAGALAAGLAHEIRNPLNAISMAAQRIERKPAAAPDHQRFASQIRQEVGRLEEILKGFLDLAKPASGPRTRTDLAVLIGEVLSLLEAEASAKDVSLHTRARDGQVIGRLDREAVRRALVNLVRNALEASPRGAGVTVHLERERDTARVRVADEGRGPDPDLVEQAFDPFFTTRADGVGLGLALVRRVAEEHGGWARLSRGPSGGAEAVLELPIEEAEP